VFRGLLADYRGFDRAVYVVLVARFVNVLGNGIVYPYFTIHFYRELSIPFSVVGAALLANNLALAAGTLAGGVLADRHGRKPVMVGSMAASAVALSAYALVTTGPALVGVAAAAGFAGGLYTPASQAALADLTDSAARDRVFGLLKVVSNGGFGAGFVAGGVLYGLANTAVFVVDGATSGVVAVVLLLTLPRIRSGAEAAATGLRATLANWRRAVSRPKLLALAGLNVVFAVSYAQMGSTVPAFATGHLGLTSEQLGTLYVLNPLVVVLFQLPTVSAVEGWRRTRGLVLSAGFWAASFVAVLAAYWTTTAVGIALVGAFLVLRTMGENLHSPLVTALGSDLADVEGRGAGLSVLEVAKRVGFGVGPLVGGVFFDYGVDELLWPALVGSCLLLAVGLLAFERRLAPAENGAPA
jgi:MFS family permease